jgi:hypothetical protein
MFQDPRVQSNMELVADEMDLLGVYLESLFNFEKFSQGGAIFSFTGMSAPIDHYFISRDAGVQLERPKPRIAPYFNDLLTFLERRGNPGWSIIALTILACASPVEQRTIQRGLERLRQSVPKEFRVPGHLCALVVHPPIQSDTLVAFYIFVEARAEDRHSKMEQIAVEAMEDASRSSCLVVALSATDRKTPYQTIGLFTAPA